MPSRVARSGRAAVDFVVSFGWGGFFRVFFFSIFFFFELTRPAASMGLPCLIYLSTSNIMVFVNYIYDMVVDTQFHKFYGRPFARVIYLFLMKDIGR